MKPNSLTNALPIVAAAYGRKFGVAVQVGGTVAQTDGLTIAIPALGDDPVARTLAWGYLTHEAAHVRYTDFDAVTRTAAKGPLAKGILNILEDVRVENAILGPYPGARDTLDAVNGWLIEHDQLAAPGEGDAPPAILGNALLVMGYHRYRGETRLTQAAKEAERVLRQTFPSRFVHRLLGLLTEIPGLGSTQDAANLTERIVALVEEEAQEPPAPQPKPSPQSESGDGEAAGGQDPVHDAGDSAGRECEESPADSCDKDPEGQDEGHPGQDGPEEAQTEDGIEGVQGGNPSDDAAQTQGRQALKALLSSTEGDLPGDTYQAVAEILVGQAAVSDRALLPSLEPFGGNARLGQDALERVRAESAKLTARLQGLVQSHVMSRVRRARRGRTLSPGALHRVAVGDPRVFQRREERAAPNTAVHLLVDLSFSMAGGADRIALDAAMALALALEPLRGVSCAATAFPGLHGSPTRVTRIQSHGDRVRGRAGAFVQSARGGTPLTGALWYAAADLLARPQARKVLITLTDGQPDDRASAADLVARATAYGLEMIGVGIATGVEWLFPVTIRIDAIADLKQALFGVAERLLIR